MGEGLYALVVSVAMLSALAYVLTKRICEVEKTNTDQQRQLDDLKRELEEIKRKQQ